MLRYDGVPRRWFSFLMGRSGGPCRGSGSGKEAAIRRPVGPTVRCCPSLSPGEVHGASFWPFPGRQRQVPETANLQVAEAEGNRTPLTEVLGHNGFEDRAAHQDGYASSSTAACTLTSAPAEAGRVPRRFPRHLLVGEAWVPRGRPIASEVIVTNPIVHAEIRSADPDATRGVLRRTLRVDVSGRRVGRLHLHRFRRSERASRRDQPAAGRRAAGDVLRRRTGHRGGGGARKTPGRRGIQDCSRCRAGRSRSSPTPAAASWVSRSSSEGAASGVTRKRRCGPSLASWHDRCAERRSLHLVLDRLGFGEGPRWHDERLWFSDFLLQRVSSVGADGDLRVELRARRRSERVGLVT